MPSYLATKGFQIRAFSQFVRRINFSLSFWVLA